MNNPSAKRFAKKEPIELNMEVNIPVSLDFAFTSISERRESYFDFILEINQG